MVARALGEMTGIYYSFKSGLCFIVLGWDGFEKSLNCITACRDSCKRLSYFMGDRRHNRLRIQEFIVSFAPQRRSQNFEVLVLLLQQILRLASLRYIAGHFCKAHERPAAIVDRADHNTCPKLTSVFADAPSFSLELAISGRLTKGLFWKSRLPI